MSETMSSKQKGNILETRFIELVSLGSSGTLSCFTPDSDDDGIDIIVNKKRSFQPLFFQIKSRFKLNKNGQYSQDSSILKIMLKSSGFLLVQKILQMTNGGNM